MSVRNFLDYKANSGATTIFKLGPPLSEFLDKFASFTRLVCQTNVLNLLYMSKNLDLSGIRTRDLWVSSR
jgi:hypothetical protein